MADLDKIKRNVAKMASMNAPEEDIDGYIASEGVTIDDVKNHKINSGIIDKIKQSANEADAANAEVRKRYEAGDIGLGSNLLQQGGNNAAVASKTIEAGYDKAASLLMQVSPVYHALSIGKDFISNNINVDPELVAAGKSAANVVGNKWQQFKEQNPVAAQNISGAGKIGMAGIDVSTVAPAKELAAPIFKKTGSALEAAGKQSFDAARRKALHNIVMDDVTAAGKEDLAKRANLSGNLGTKTYNESFDETKMIDAIKDLDIKPSDALTVTLNKVQNENKRLGQKLSSYIEKNDVPVPDKEISGLVDNVTSKISKNRYLGADADSKNVSEIFGKLNDLINKNGKTVKGLYQTRKEFDAWAKSQKPEGALFDGDLSGVVKDSVNDIRRGLNDIVEKSIPDANYKDILRKQSGLMSAEDIIAKKSAKEPASYIGRQAKKIDKALTLKGAVVGAGGLAGIGGTAIMSGLPAAAAVGAVGYGGYKAATNPKVWQKIGAGLKNAGEFLSPSEIAKLPPKEAAKVMQQQKQQLLLAAPDKMSAIPMSERDIALSAAKISKNKKFPETPAVIKQKPSPDQLPQKLLPAPKVMEVSPSGKATLQSGETMEKAASERKRLSDIGMTGDVRRIVSQKEIREKFGSSWDKLDAEQRNKIAEQINKAWKSSTLPLNKIIEKAKIDSLRLADAKGMKLTLGTMADALVNAKPIKVKK